MLDGSGRRLGDVDEVGVAAGEPELDVPVGELGVEPERRLREEVEQAQLQRRSGGVGETAAGLGHVVAAERCGGGEVGLDCGDVTCEIHACSMTSF